MRKRRWLVAALEQIHELASKGRVRFTLKAFRELAVLDTGFDENIGLDEEDAQDVLANLTAVDFIERIASKETGEWMYVFKPHVGEVVLYVKVIVRGDCVVISFH